ncbi:beta-ketoacyl synthase N-terminal-like domain-containing protein [Amycolatopsis sp. WGS_07]|uniref:beta-ketoacyl synthase N-terminal-like domain-containing protein n=1 Tax=Amycolatopsis sp. WGS_07 TaxID=3076764 RepID=UPI003873099E
MSVSVVVTGAGVVSPAGADWKAHADGLYTGRSLVRPLSPPLFPEYSAFRRPIGARALFDADREDRSQPRFVAMAEAAAAEAVGMGGGPDAISGTRVAVVGATAVGAALELEAAYRRGIPAPGLFTFDLATEAVATLLGTRGPKLTVTTGCTAGLDALGTGLRLIRSELADAAIVVAADAALSPIVTASFQRIGALSRRDCHPAKASTPFAADRDGFTLGEGAAAILLERADRAAARGVRPIARLLGWASVSSALHMTALRKDGEDIAGSIRMALADAAVPADAVDLLDAHGTSTPLNDMSEAAAYQTVFGARAARIPLTAQKGVVGHALGASNLLEVAGVVSFLVDGKLAPIANTTAETLAYDVGAVLGSPPAFFGEFAVKTSSGFAGIHTTCVMGAAL